MKNPFIINGIVPDEYFCDRVHETDKLIKCIGNQTNVLLTSPRRMGKTQLIRHVYNQNEISENYHTFYVDIYSTTSLHEFILLLSKEIYTQLVPKGRQALDVFISVLKSLTGSFGYDPMTGLPVFDVRLGDIRSPELTLSEIFSYLENTDKPCVCTIAKFGAECHTASFETSDDHLSYRRQDKGVLRIRSLSSDVDCAEVLIHLHSFSSAT